ncbi:hypothetical protein, partial [Cryobacterium sp. Y50]|uniref:hypothetical protein n=1 Tax=Cryobacterium sp. Y50 TaxID=2048286 RepID=UPI001E40BE19
MNGYSAVLTQQFTRSRGQLQPQESSRLECRNLIGNRTPRSEMVLNIYPCLHEFFSILCAFCAIIVGEGGAVAMTLTAPPAAAGSIPE